MANGSQVLTLQQALELGVQRLNLKDFLAAMQIAKQILAVKPASIDALNLLGLAQLRSGQSQAAIESYKVALAVDSRMPLLHCNLALALQSAGNDAQAEREFQVAIELQGDMVEAHLGLGRLLATQNRLKEACDAYRDALRFHPDHSVAYSELANLLDTLGQPESAISAYQEAIRLNPNLSTAPYNLATVLMAQDRQDEALIAFDTAISLRPDFFEAHLNRGVLLSQRRDFAGALSALAQAVSLNPASAIARTNMASTLAECGKLGDARHHLDIVLAQHPDHADAYNTYGVVLLMENRLTEAIAMLEEAISIKPNSPKALNSLGNALRLGGQISQAVLAYEKSLKLDPHYAIAVNNLGSGYKSMGRIPEAIETYARALALKPDYAAAHSNYVYCHNFEPGITLSKLRELHLAWDKIHATPFRSHWGSYSNTKDVARPLVIGFVSGDFRRHPVGYFTIKVFESLAAAGTRIIVYANQVMADDMTARFKQASHTWRDIYGVSDDDVASQIRQDKVDILFDLSGHNDANRLLVLARKPAPVQIEWAGYMATTGVAAMDYLIADRHHVPTSAERHYSERILRMNDAFICFEPPQDALQVGSLPLAANGYPTFGCFNIVDKINDNVIDAWARLLSRLPESKLVLKTRELSCPVVRDRYRDSLARRGIAPTRLEFVGGSSRKEHLAWYNRIDVALDPFPFSGSTTTLEALWMGVPVVTLPGETFASRHSLSFVSTIGLSHLAVSSVDEYIDKACALTADRNGLVALRATLRSMLEKSPLCDARRFSENLLAQCHFAWKGWCDAT